MSASIEYKHALILDLDFFTTHVCCANNHVIVSDMGEGLSSL